MGRVMQSAHGGTCWGNKSLDNAPVWGGLVGGVGGKDHGLAEHATEFGGLEVEHDDHHPVLEIFPAPRNCHIISI